MNLFAIYHHSDTELARNLTGTLAGRGLEIGDPVVLWPQMRLLPRVDQGLVHARFCLVIVSTAFLDLAWERKTLDGLALRRRVVTVLANVTERDVAAYSPRLAVASVSTSDPAIDSLARLFQEGGAMEDPWSSSEAG